MKGLRIGSISQILGIPASAIRYYEECGLVTPAKDKNSGYRYYSPEDCGKIMCARSFRSMGLSIQDSKELMTQQDLLAQLEIWQKGRSSIDRQIERLEAQRRTLDYWHDLYIASDQLRKTCRPFSREGFYFVPLGKWGQVSENREFQEIAAQWIEYMPEASYWGLVDAEDVQNSLPITLDCGFGMRESCASREHLVIPESATFYPPATCIQTVLYCGSDMTILQPAQFDHVREYAREQRLRLIGTGHWHFLQLAENGDGLYAFSFPVEAL